MKKSKFGQRLGKHFDRNSGQIILAYEDRNSHWVKYTPDETWSLSSLKLGDISNEERYNLTVGLKAVSLELQEKL